MRSVGKPQFLRSQGIPDLEQLEGKAAELQQQGQTVIFVAIIGRAAGFLRLPIRSRNPRRKPSRNFTSSA